MSKKSIRVAVGIVLRDGQVFLTRRAEDAHQGGKWEFPGGKVEAGETTEQALKRELYEEVGIKVHTFESYMTIEHDYPERFVRLEFALLTGFDGEPESREGLQWQWLEVDRLSELDFPEANKPVIERLLSEHL